MEHCKRLLAGRRVEGPKRPKVESRSRELQAAACAPNMSALGAAAYSYDVFWRFPLSRPLLLPVSSSLRTHMTILTYVLIGLGAGVLAGIFGIGGGIVIVPALILLAAMSPVKATGTSLGALILPTGIFGVWQYYRHGHLDIRASLLIALGLTGGIFVGATLAQGLQPDLSRRAFAIFMVLVAIRMWFKTA